MLGTRDRLEIPLGYHLPNLLSGMESPPAQETFGDDLMEGGNSVRSPVSLSYEGNTLPWEEPAQNPEVTKNQKDNMVVRPRTSNQQIPFLLAWHYPK